MDELERRIRRARPISGRRDLPLTDRAKRELAELVLSDSAQPSVPGVAPARSRVRARILASTLAATVGAAAVMIAVAVRVSSTDFVAFTPAPLTTMLPADGGEQAFSSPVDDSIADALNASFSYRAWSLDDTASREAIAPTIHVWRVAEDGSRTETVTAAKPTLAPGGDTTGVPSAGTVLDEREWAPGQFTSPYLAPLPEDVSGIGSYLASAEGSATDLSGAEALRAVADLLVVQRLTSAQTLALTAYLADLPDVTAVGKVVDREGRDGVALAATAPDSTGERPSLIVSPEGTRVLDFEIVYEGESREGVKAPAVVAYTVWLDDPPG